MRFIVHIGMPKCGSTALQEGLSAMRASLARQGVLYPTSPVIEDTANFLMAGVQDFDDLPRYLRHAITTLLPKGRSRYQTLYQEWIGQIGDQAKAMAAHTVILSAENLYNISTAVEATKLRDTLIAIGASSIEIVLYVRKPSDWYLSAAQQVLRASHRVRPVGPVAYREVIETYSLHVSPDIKVFEYNRSKFPSGDILAHFIKNAGGIETQAIDMKAERQFNGTISAEGMSLLRDYRFANHKRRNDTFLRDSAIFRQALAEADDLVGGEKRPALQPKLKDKIDHGSPDILWLRDHFGVEFEGINYDRISAEPWGVKFRRVERICVVDKRRRNILLNKALFLLCSKPPAPKVEATNESPPLQ